MPSSSKRSANTQHTPRSGGEGGQPGTRGLCVWSTTYWLYSEEYPRGLHKGHPIHQAVLGNVTCAGGGAQAPSGSGALFSGACTRPDNATFANSLTTATLGRAAGQAGWGQEAGDERKMQNLHSGDGAICTLGPVCVPH